MADVISKFITDLEEWSSHARIPMPQDAPIGGLPPEIVSQIFLLSVAHLSTRAALYFVLSSINFVCVDWRNIALDTPQLFSSIDLDLFYDKPEVVRFLLAHAGAALLHLSAESGYVEWEEIAPLLQNYASRWVSVALNPSSQYISDLGHLKLPVLEDLYAVLTPPCVNHCLDFVAHAPRLRRLEICSLVDCGPEEGHHTDFFLEVLRHCALTLEDLELKMEAWRNHSDCLPKSYASITLPRLSSARLSQYTHTVLGYVVAPRLSQVVLSLSTEASGDGDVFTSLLALLNRGPNAIESLIIEHVFVESSSDFVRCLHKLTHLTTLKIEGYPGTRKLMDTTTLKALNRSAMLPSLQNIVVHYLGGIWPATLDMWYAFLDWRSQERTCEGVVVKALTKIDTDVPDVSLRASSPDYGSALFNL
ncbi:hypothetical protein FB107DRAFT_277311 [Schizophyllum commune]